MTRFTSKTVMIAVTVALGWAGWTAGAKAATDFEGKRINVIIGSTPGGGTDGTTRLVGRYLEKYLPGKPQMLYRNMPAGHGVKASNYFANVVKNDGTYWMGGSSSYLDANNLRKKVVKYDPTKYTYIGGIVRGGSVVIINKKKLANLTDKSKEPAVAGVLDGSRTWAQMLIWGAEYLDWNIRFVVGYPGSAALAMAARRGEIDMFGTSQLSVHQNLAKTGQFVGLSQVGQFSDGKHRRRTSFKDVPLITDLMKGKTSGLVKKAFDYWIEANKIDKWYALPPNTPEDIAEVYRAAFAKASQDPDFIKYGKLQFSADFTSQVASDLAVAVNVTSYPDDDLLNYMQSIRVKHGLPANQLTDDEMKALAKKLGGGAGLTVKAKLDDVKRGGRWLHFKNDGAEHKTKISSSRTKVSIGGKKAKRNALKPGMVCEISYAGDGGEAQSVSCGVGTPGQS